MFLNQLLTRRRALKIGAAGLAGIGATVATKAICHSKQTEVQRDYTVVGGASLKARAAAKGFIYGAATARSLLQEDADFATRFVRESDILVPEWELKWDAVRPAPDKFDFSRGDWLVEFAQHNGILFRGHTLVWEQALPQWFKETVNRQNAEKFLVEHVATVTKHYAGKVHSWDVVNEAVSAQDSDRPDRLSKSPWLSLLDKNYIELAFRVAAKADPHALLVYNDRWLEYDTARDTAQRVAVLNLLAHLKSVGTPVQALGIQAHLDASETRFNPNVLRKFLKDVASLGLKILITELDAQDQNLPQDIKVRDQAVARAYEDYLSVVLDEPAVIGVLNWGLSDRYTWLSKYASRADGYAVRPLPLDINLKPKLAWNAMARAFDKAPKH